MKKHFVRNLLAILICISMIGISTTSAIACELIAIGAGAASAIFPPIAALGGLSAAYYARLANRINANHQGNGVYVAITWAAVFNIEPL